MKTIKTMRDLCQLRGAMKSALLSHLTEYLEALRESLEPDTAMEQFSLARHGYIVILEASDDVRDLREVGMRPEQKGLLGSWPEWVELVTLEDGSTIYRIGIMYDNDFMMLFYSSPGQFDEQVEEWLAEQLT